MRRDTTGCLAGVGNPGCLRVDQGVLLTDASSSCPLKMLVLRNMGARTGYTLINKLVFILSISSFICFSACLFLSSAAFFSACNLEIESLWEEDICVNRVKGKPTEIHNNDLCHVASHRTNLPVFRLKRRFGLVVYTLKLQYIIR